MFINSWPNRKPGEPTPPETKTYFDFAVSQRPIYKRGTGPALSLPTPCADHSFNSDGTIIDFIPGTGGIPMFLVGSVSQPALRVTIKMIDILDWVSAKTYEDWELARSMEEKKQKESTLKASMHWKAKRKLEKLAESRAHGGSGHEERVGGSRIAVEIGGQRRVSGNISMLGTTSPGRRRRISSIEGIAAQPSLISPNQQYQGLVEIMASDSSEGDEDVEMMDTQLALERQLNGVHETSRSTPDPLASSPTQSSQPTMLPTKRASSKLEKEKMNYTSSNQPKQPRLASTSPSASSPRNKPTPQKRINSFFLPGQKLSSKVKKPSPRKPEKATRIEMEPVEDEEPEWEVQEILDDRNNVDFDGAPLKQYLIKWVGDYDNSWEPRGYVSNDLIRAYHRAKKARKLDAQYAPQHDGDGKTKRLQEKKRKREESESRRERSTRSMSYISTNTTETGRARKKPSRSPAILHAPDDIDRDDTRVSRKKPSRSPAILHNPEDIDTNDMRAPRRSRSREQTASSGLFIDEQVAPVANMFSAPPPTNGNAKGKQVIKETIEIGSSSESESEPEPAPQIREQQSSDVIMISSGEEDSEDDDADDDELA